MGAMTDALTAVNTALTGAGIAAVISLRNCSCAPEPKAIQLFISSSGARAAMLESMRFCISATIYKFG